MGETEQNPSEESQPERGAAGPPDTGTDQVSEGRDRPEGTDDDDADPPQTDSTKSEVHREPDTGPPQDARLMGPSGT